MSSFRSPPYAIAGDDAIAWLHFYRNNGQEWWLVEVDDQDMYGMKYNGEFRMGFFNPKMLRMVTDIVLDVKWTPKSLKEIKRTHVCCESLKAMSRSVNYAQEMAGRR